MLPDQELKALLEAAKKWERGCGCEFTDLSRACKHMDASHELEDLAPDLAQQVLDLRGAGTALANKLHNMAMAYHFKACGSSPSFNLCEAELCLHNKAGLARWADLHEEGKRDGA